VSVVQFKLS